MHSFGDGPNDAGRRPHPVVMDPVQTVSESPAAVMLTGDDTLGRHVLSAAAAVGLEVELTSEPAQLRAAWRTATMVLVGFDQAAEVEHLRLPRRPEVYVLGFAADQDQTDAWSARLRAAVLTLPEGAGDLAERMAQLVGGPTGANVAVCVVGGCGGVGASTLAAGLAVTSARAGARTLLIDGDPLGGGIDLLLGAEQLEGWRWSRLAAARGYLGDLGAQLPGVDGVDLLAMDRGTAPPPALAPEQVRAVAGWAARRYRLAVWDLPRHLGPAADEAVRRADETLLVVQADVRGVAAASAVAARLHVSGGFVGLVVRRRRSRGLDAVSVANAMALPLRATVEDEPALAGGAERGDPPGRTPRSPLSRSCRTLLGRTEDARRAA